MNAAGVSATFDPARLDDPAWLLDADREGWLRGAASAGAAVRAVAGAAAEGALDRLRESTVRSVVLLAPHGPGMHAASLLQALFAATSTVPVVHAARTPRWVGALDVVVVATDDPGDPELAESVAQATGRGAHVVLATPQEGLLVPAAAGRALLLPPRLPMPEGMGLPRFLAVGLAVLATLQVAATPALAELADELDAEAERNQRNRDLLANPAKALALRCAGRRLSVVADAPGPRVLTATVAAALLRHAGVVASSGELADALAAQVARAHRRTGQPEQPVDPIFHDPEFDGPPAEPAVRLLLLGTATELRRLRLRSAHLPDVELAVGSIEGGALQENPTAELMQLAARCTTAAVYLGLAA